MQHLERYIPPHLDKTRLWEQSFVKTPLGGAIPLAMICCWYTETAATQGDQPLN